jgi:hypothetical protein
MPKTLKCLTHDDILPLGTYESLRGDARARIINLKKDRRIAVGPYGSFTFENFDTMWFQVHEMLYVEKGGEEQLADELGAYNPLIPQDNELVATLFFEIDKPIIRKAFLETIGGVEHKVSLSFGSHKIWGIPKHDVEHTNDQGKASAVHFIHFSLNNIPRDALNEGWKLAIEHPNYNHQTGLTTSQIQALKEDLI